MEFNAPDFICSRIGCDRPASVMFAVVGSPSRFVPLCYDCRLEQVMTTISDSKHRLPIDDSKLLTLTKDQP